MKVLMLAADDGACAKYRLEEPARVLRDEVEIEIRRDVLVDGVVENGLVTVNRINHEVDLVVISRPLGNYAVSFIEQAHKQGIKVIVDIDDDFKAVHPGNIAYDKIDPAKNPTDNWEWLEKACRAADLLTVSTPALMKYSDRSVVLRNQMPDEAFSVERRKGSKPRIGWAGTLKSHPVDLLELGTSVKSVVLSGDATFSIVGDGKGVEDQIGVSAEISGYVPLADYYSAVARNIDIGVVPLELSDFNAAKSALKGMEYSAMGIPAVMSPTPENLRLAEEGIGVIAENARDYKKLLRELSRNARKRNQLGRRSQELMWEKHRYVDHAQEWLNAWESVLAGQELAA